MKQLAILLIVCMLLLSGCTQQANQQTAQQTGQPQNTAQPTTTPEQPATTTEQTQPAQSPLEQLGNLLTRSATLEYKVNYEIASEETSQMTMYLKGMGENQKLRVQSTVNENEINAYMLGKSMYVCTKSEGMHSCFKMMKTKDNDPSSAVNLGFTKEDLSLPSMKITPDGTYEVSGMIAPCFKIQKDEEPIQRVCMTMDGAMVYYESTIDDKTTVVRALSYTKTVPDSDFELPAGAEITDVSSMGYQ